MLYVGSVTPPFSSLAAKECAAQQYYTSHVASPCNLRGNREEPFSPPLIFFFFFFFSRGPHRQNRIASCGAAFVVINDSVDSDEKNRVNSLT